VESFADFGVDRRAVAPARVADEKRLGPRAAVVGRIAVGGGTANDLEASFENRRRLALLVAVRYTQPVADAQRQQVEFRVVEARVLGRE
jgi:hypothetical protein